MLGQKGKNKISPLTEAEENNELTNPPLCREDKTGSEDIAVKAASQCCCAS